MCCPCMVATISLPTRNKLNCFISARGMLTIIWHCTCTLVFFIFLFLQFNKSSSQRKEDNKSLVVVISCVSRLLPGPNHVEGW